MIELNEAFAAEPGSDRRPGSRPHEGESAGRGDRARSSAGATGAIRIATLLHGLRGMARSMAWSRCASAPGWVLPASSIHCGEHRRPKPPSPATQESLKTLVSAAALQSFPAFWGTGAKVIYMAETCAPPHQASTQFRRTSTAPFWRGCMPHGSAVCDPGQGGLGPGYIVWDRAGAIRYRKPAARRFMQNAASAKPSLRPQVTSRSEPSSISITNGVDGRRWRRACSGCRRPSMLPGKRRISRSCSRDVSAIELPRCESAGRPGGRKAGRKPQGGNQSERVSGPSCSVLQCWPWFLFRLHARAGSRGVKIPRQREN